ncbi:MAG: hypothetical protein HZY79_05710 [Rhodoblastus sp.]|nr:MAG: hypothetical protein HZY79_05710 [Rhodoblastus sp.]
MTHYFESREASQAEPLTRMAGVIFDDRPAAVRGGLQVVFAVMIGVLMGNTLNILV